MKLGPKEIKVVNEYFVRPVKNKLKEIFMKKGLPQLKTPDEVQRPDDALRREMFEDANKRFNKADGGRIELAEGTIPLETFKKEYSKFKGSSDRDFTNFLNKKYKTDLSVGAIETRRRRAGIATKNPKNIGDTAGFRKEINKFKGSERYKGFVKDLADKYSIDRKTADTIISKERPDIKELPNKKPNYLVKAEKAKEATKLKNKNYLSDEAIKKEYKLFKPKLSGTDKEFLEFLNKKGYKAFGDKPLSVETIATRRQRLGLKSKALTLETGGTGQRFTDKFIKEEAKRLNVSTKGTAAEVRKRVLRKRGDETFIKKFGEEALLERKRTKAKENLEKIKADPKRLEALRESKRKYNQKRMFGLVPTELNPKGLLYRDLIENALRYQSGNLQNSHIKFKNPNEKRPSSIPKTKEVKLIDTNIIDPKTKKPKVITYDNVLKHIDDTQDIYGTDSKKTLGEYKKKRFIQENKDLRDAYNAKVNKAYDPTSATNRAVFSPMHIHHTAGRGQNAFNVQFAVATENMQENALRTRLNRQFKSAKTFGEQRTAVKEYLSKVPPTLEVRLKNTPYGQRETLVDMTKRIAPDLTKKVRQAGGVELGANPFFNPGILKEAFKQLPTPAGAVLLNAGFGVDPRSSIDRASIAAEAAFAPALVKQAAKLGSVGQRIANLGLTPAMAARAARIASPLGIASLAAEGLYQGGKFTKKRMEELRSMTPEQRAELRRQGEAQAFDPFQAAGGGIAKLAGDRSGAMLTSMNPDKDGLQGPLNRGKKQ
jgi:hypothetical protein